MNIRWLGHASFLITAANGTKVITDPYESGKGLGYAPIEESADLVLVSHKHFDHSNVASVKGNPVAIHGTGKKTVKGIEVQAFPTYHDEQGGKQRGENTLYTFTVYGVKLGFCGDLGHPLTADLAAQVGKVDVLLLPVGGFYTIDAAAADRVCESLSPKMVIPMHYKNSKCAFPIATVDEFVKSKQNVRREQGSEIEVSPDRLPAATEVVVLQPAL